MSSPPKKQDYQPGKNEIAVAQQGKKNFDKFQTLFNPALKDLRDEAVNNPVKEVFRGRANADTMQALTSGPSYDRTQQVGGSALAARALTDQVGSATKTAQQASNKLGVDVLATRNQQAGVASAGLSKLASMDNTKTLKDAKNSLLVRDAKLKMGTDLAFAGADKFGRDLFGDKFGDGFDAFKDALSEQRKA